MHAHDDDLPVGRILSRRAAVRLLGAGSLSLLGLRAAASAGRRPVSQAPAPKAGCIVKPEMTEGPYFVDRQLHRSDIRVEGSTNRAKTGEVLALALTVFEAGGECRPLPGATVDLWQCDANGVYSGVSDPTQGFTTVGQNFLRGFQTTDAGGVVRFTTIYPGWYTGRTVHIHFKIRCQAPGGAYEFTSQWYFDESLNERVLAGRDYVRAGRRDTTNSSDMHYRNGGDQLLLAPTRTADGFAANFAVGLDLSDTAAGRPDGFALEGRGRGRGRGGPGGPPGGRGRGGPGV